MKILELGKFYPPHLGGMETLLRSFCEGFSGRGAEVDCVVANEGPVSQGETCSGVRVHRLASFGQIASTSLCPRYLSATRRFAADVWHHHFPNPLGDLACLAGSPRTPCVVTYHSDIVRQSGWLRVYSRVIRRLLNRADRIVVATPDQLDHSPWLQAVRAKCEVIPFGIDLTRLSTTEGTESRAAELRREWGTQPVLLTIGRLVGYKGHRYLLEALKDLQAVLWIVGTGPLEGALRRQATDLGLDQRVHFWGSVNEARLPELLHACDVFVLPSITPNEAFGLVQVEAMACGKPVVSCRLASGVPYVNRDGVTGFTVPPKESGALAGRIGLLLGDPSLRQKLGKGARDRAFAEFSLPAMIDRYWNLFSRLSRFEAGC